MMVASGTGSTTGVTPGVTIMRHPTHLLSKGGVYYARFRIPKDLADWISQSEIRWSLRTGHLKSARHRINLATLIIHDFYRHARLEIAHAPLTDAEKTAIKQRIQEIKAEKMRQFQAMLGDGDAGPLDARDFLDQQQSWLTTLQAAIEMDDFDQPDVIWPASDILQPVNRLAYDFSANNPNLRYLARQFSASMLKVHGEMQRLLNNPPGSMASAKVSNAQAASVESPSEEHSTSKNKAGPTVAEPATTQETPPATPRISVVSEAYLQELDIKGRRTKTLVTYRQEYQRFIDFSDDIACDQITRKVIRNFRDALLRHPKGRLTPEQMAKPFATRLRDERGPDTLHKATINKYLERLEQLFSWGRIEGYLIAQDLTKGMTIPDLRSDREKRDRFDEADIVKLFSTPDYQGEKHFAKTAYYWAPLIALYSVARLEEVCQLHLSDFATDNGVHYIDINDLDDKEVKPSQAGKRRTPIHSKLIELGLLDYVETLRKVGHKNLFPTLNPHPLNGHGHSVSNWFSKRKKALGFDQLKAFHSFRHTGTDESLQVDNNEMMTNALAGHVANATMSSRVYGKGMSPSSLKPFIESLVFSMPAKPYHECKFATAEVRALQHTEAAQALRERRLVAARKRQKTPAD